jgi:hypothetical protein
MVLCWRDSSRWDTVVVLVFDPFGNGLHQLYFFDYENEDEKQSNRHFRRLPIEPLLSNCPEEATFSERSLGKSLVPYVPIVWLNVSNNFDWVLQSIGFLSVQCSGRGRVVLKDEHRTMSVVCGQWSVGWWYLFNRLGSNIGHGLFVMAEDRSIPYLTNHLSSQPR